MDDLNKVKQYIKGIKNNIQEIDKNIEILNKEMEINNKNAIEINKNIQNFDNLSKILKYSSIKSKNIIKRELIHNYNKYQNINRINKEKRKKLQKEQYDQYKILKELLPDSLIECKICYEYKKDILVSIKCGHILCQDCYNKIKIINANPKCPNCNIEYNNQKPIKLYI